jgi:hypothetical protein
MAREWTEAQRKAQSRKLKAAWRRKKAQAQTVAVEQEAYSESFIQRLLRYVGVMK